VGVKVGVKVGGGVKGDGLIAGESEGEGQTEGVGLGVGNVMTWPQAKLKVSRANTAKVLKGCLLIENTPLRRVYGREG